MIFCHYAWHKLANSLQALLVMWVIEAKYSETRQFSFPFVKVELGMIRLMIRYRTECHTVTTFSRMRAMAIACRVTSAVTLYGSRSVVNQPFVDMNSICFVMYPASFKETGLELYPSFKHNGWQMEIEKVDIEKPELPHLNALDGQQPRKPRLGMSKESERQCYNPYMQLATTVLQWTVRMETCTIYINSVSTHYVLKLGCENTSDYVVCAEDSWHLSTFAVLLFLPKDTLNFWRCKV